MIISVFPRPTGGGTRKTPRNGHSLNFITGNYNCKLKRLNNQMDSKLCGEIGGLCFDRDIGAAIEQCRISACGFFALPEMNERAQVFVKMQDSPSLAI